MSACSSLGRITLLIICTAVSFHVVAEGRMQVPNAGAGPSTNIGQQPKSATNQIIYTNPVGTCAANGFVNGAITATYTFATDVGYNGTTTVNGVFTNTYSGAWPAGSASGVPAGFGVVIDPPLASANYTVSAIEIYRNSTGVPIGQNLQSFTCSNGVLTSSDTWIDTLVGVPTLGSREIILLLLLLAATGLIYTGRSRRG